ncbi:MAG: four helix bundle protein [Bacteroidales bacterium]|nr:four helix bundle protein [Bacteroidales bacterium]
MANDLLQEKGLNFAVRCVNLMKLLNERHEFVISKQMMRSGTSIGANISESQSAQSDMDYISKLSISLKEARETKYWFDLLYRTEYIDEKEYCSMCTDVKEMIALLTTLIKSKKQKLGVE